MNHTRHQFLWMVRRRRALLATYALGWAVAWWLSWQSCDGYELMEGVEVGPRALFSSLHILLLIMAGSLALDAGEVAPAPGTDTFWRTRPPRWRPVWLGQVFYIIVALAGPAIGCWTVNGFLLDQSAAQWRAGLLAPVGLVCVLLVLTAVASLAGQRGVLPLTLVGLIAGGALVAKVVAEEVENLNRRYGGFPELVGNFGAFLMVVSVVPAAVVALVWVLELRRDGGRTRDLPSIIYQMQHEDWKATLWRWRWKFGTAAALLLLPALTWLVVRRLVVVELSLAPAVPGEKPAAGEVTLGILKARGMPEGMEFTSWEDRLGTEYVGNDRLVETRGSVQLEQSWSVHPDWLTGAAGARLRGAFPAGTRWYSDEAGEGSYWFSLGREPGAETVRVKLSGGIRGTLYAPAKGFEVPLEAGADIARRGTRLRVIKVEPGQRNLLVRVEVRQSAPAFYEDGVVLKGVLVLHLPALPAAVVMEERQVLFFLSPQCAGALVELRMTMPDAEQAAGARFTPEVLRGAEMWHFAPAEATPFLAVPEEGEMTLHPPGELPPR